MTDTRELELVDGFLDAALVDAPMETDPDTLIETATRAHNALCYNHRHCFGSNPKSTLVGDLAMALTAQAERIAELEKRLAGLHQSAEKMRDTANREFHRANRADSVLCWIAENGRGEEARRARAALAGKGEA